MPSTPLPRSTQVLVVGGGPAGSATAWHCARAGFDVTLIDRAHFPRSKPCAEYVSPEGGRILAAMGALPQLEATAAGLTGMLVRTPSGGRIHGEFVAQHGFRGFRDHGLGIRREVLDRVLLDCARDAGVRVHEGVRVRDLTRDAHGRVTGVRVSDDDRDTTSTSRDATIEASIVVGADGLRSVVSRRAGLARRAPWPNRVAVVAHYRGVSGIGTLGEMHVTRDGYVGLAAVDDGLTNVALVVPASMSRAMHGNPGEFLDSWLARNRELATRFTQAERVTTARATGPFAARARRPWAPGVALVGDAADFFDPFTGEGIFAALRSGELLAPFVAQVLSSRGNAQTEHQALRAYDRARRHTFAGKWRVERLIGAAMAYPSLMNAAARVLGRDRALADLLIGVTGDFVPASAMLAPRTLHRIARAMLRAFTPVSSSATDAPIAASPIPTHVHRS